MKIGKLYYIEWLDAAAQSGWMKWKEGKKWKPQVKQKTIGWLFHDSKYMIGICSTIG